MSLGWKALIGSSWLIVSQTLVRFIGIFSTIILARLLTPADFGLLALMVAIRETVALAFSIGPQSFLVREKEIDARKYNTAFTINVIRAVLISGIIWLAAAPLAIYLENDRIRDVLYVGAIGTLTQGFINTGMTMYVKDMNFAPQAKIAFLGSFLSIIVTVLLALWWRNYWALIVGSVIQAVLSVTLSYNAHPFRPRFSLFA